MSRVATPPTQRSSRSKTNNGPICVTDGNTKEIGIVLLCRVAGEKHNSPYGRFRSTEYGIHFIDRCAQGPQSQPGWRRVQQAHYPATLNAETDRKPNQAETAEVGPHITEAKLSFTLHRLIR